MNPWQIFQQFQQFKQSFIKQNPNVNPQQKVQELLNTGKMTQQQFEQLRTMANTLMGKR